TGDPITFTGAVAVIAPNATVIFAVPAPTAVTVPVASTVATETLSLENTKVAPVTTLLFASSVCVVSLNVWPIESVGAVFVTLTCAIGPATAVAVNVTVVSPVADAVSVFAPTVVPSFQAPTVAMPL